MTNLNEIQSNFPFLSCVVARGQEYVCIIQNHDDKIMTFYDLDAIRNPDEKKLLLSLGDMWWWESNRMLPINIFLGQQMRRFRYCTKTVAMKDVEVKFGPQTSLNNLLKKRIKRRQIQLVRKI